MPAVQCPQCDTVLDWRSVDTLMLHVRGHREIAFATVLAAMYESIDQEETWEEFTTNLDNMSDILLNELLEGFMKMNKFILTEN